ncbi:hypothetical protein MGYG_08896 [Nannizzia gypsea CBS 118893]|uniref:Uncharacterized protein n=1 Tax=Arthroderma gypseum (strain ATCC MYA-4604 / CBS 118893) TaxID=535722 RepID=E5R063_ARTGP|nr:hypothetical protein MGYG_08896 [Nannizzia gypsea CBS 118893]EFQ97474.1 hypothetical protein MGYG_08896 [Nannizzia gypsea CBS 118893]
MTCLRVCPYVYSSCAGSQGQPEGVKTATHGKPAAGTVKQGKEDRGQAGQDPLRLRIFFPAWIRRLFGLAGRRR